MQFGEGGAGAFSDGKLNSGIKDAHCREVLETLARFGAPEEILWEARPHVGTDRLPAVVRAIRQEIVRLGGEVLFEARLTKLIVGKRPRCVGADVRTAAGETCAEVETRRTSLLAVGHSARDTFAMLHQIGRAHDRPSRFPSARGSSIRSGRSSIGPSTANLPAIRPWRAADYQLERPPARRPGRLHLLHVPRRPRWWRRLPKRAAW